MMSCTITAGVRSKHLNAAVRRLMRLAQEHSVLVIGGYQRSFLWRGEIEMKVRGKDANVEAFAKAAEGAVDIINGVPT